MWDSEHGSGLFDFQMSTKVSSLVGSLWGGIHLEDVKNTMIIPISYLYPRILGENEFSRKEKNVRKDSKPRFKEKRLFLKSKPMHRVTWRKLEAFLEVWSCYLKGEMHNGERKSCERQEHSTGQKVKYAKSEKRSHPVYWPCTD